MPAPMPMPEPASATANPAATQPCRPSASAASAKICAIFIKLPTFLAGRSLSKNLNVRVQGCKPDRRSFEVNAGKVASRPSGEVFDGAEAGRDGGAGGGVLAPC